MSEKPSGRRKSKPAPPEWSKFRLDAEVLAGLDAIAAWLDAQGIRQPRRGPAGASRADAVRYAVEQTVQAINGQPRKGSADAENGGGAKRAPATSKAPARST